MQAEIGGHRSGLYGFPQLASRWDWGDVDYAVFSNEDLGFTADLVTGTNDRLQISYPYPATIDLFEETMRLFAVEFNYSGGASNNLDNATMQLLIYLGMLNRQFALTYRGIGADAADLALKAQFAGGMLLGFREATIGGAGATLPYEMNADAVGDVLYFPPWPVKLTWPMIVQFINTSSLWTAATAARVATDFTEWELVSSRLWFDIVPLTRAEMDVRNVQLRLARMDA